MAVGVVVWALGWPLLNGYQVDFFTVAWSALIGAFLWSGAGAAITGGRTREAVAGLTVASLAYPAVAVPVATTVSDAVAAAQRAGAGHVVLTDALGRPVAYADPAAVAAVPSRPGAADPGRGRRRRAAAHRAGGRAPHGPGHARRRGLRDARRAPARRDGRRSRRRAARREPRRRGAPGRARPLRGPQPVPGTPAPGSRLGWSPVTQEPTHDAPAPSAPSDVPASPAPTATGADVRRGPLRLGDKVQLTDPRGRLHTITLATGATFHTHRGYLNHEDLVGLPEGSVVRNTAGIEYLALRPLLADYVLSMPRGAAVVYPKDAGPDRRDGRHLPRCARDRGRRRLGCPDHVAAACGGRRRARCTRSSGARTSRRSRAATSSSSSAGRTPRGSSRSGTCPTSCPRSRRTGSIDRVVLDMLAPWENLDAVADALAPGGVLDLLRRDHDPALASRRGPACRRPVRRAVGLGVHGPRLAPRGPRGAPAAPHDRAHGLPAHRPPAGRRRRSRRCASVAPPRARTPYAESGVDARGPGRALGLRQEVSAGCAATSARAPELDPRTGQPLVPVPEDQAADVTALADDDAPADTLDVSDAVDND